MKGAFFTEEQRNLCYPRPMKTFASDATNVRKPVGIWIRVSTEEQAKGESPEYHEIRARAYAEAKGWDVVALYDLAGVSGKSVEEHPEAQRMLADVREARITGLIFSKLARLARNTRQLLEFSDLFNEHGADLVSLGENIDTSTPVGRLFYTVIAAMAQWEREETASRVKASVAVRAQLGRSLGGTPVYGYRWNEQKQYVPNPAEVPVRKMIYELFLENRRLKTVAAILNERGYRTRKGAMFTDSTVKYLIKDPTAKGQKRMLFTETQNRRRCVLKPRDEWQWSKVEPIVSEEIWTKCNAMLDERKQNHLPPGKRPVHLLAGITTCHCGAKMYVPASNPKYICFRHGCRNKIPVVDLEGVFLEQLKAYFLDLQRVAASVAKGNETLNEKRALLEAKNRERDKIRSEMNEILALFREKQIKRETFTSLFRPLEDRLEQVVATLPKLQAEVDLAKVDQLSVDAIQSEAKTLHDAWSKLSGEEKRQIVESLTERIVVGDTEIEITLTGSSTCKEMIKRQHDLGVTLAAADHPATFAHPAPGHLRPQPARRPPQSLSLGSLGEATRVL
jgi:site-specific DNA recombinase